MPSRTVDETVSITRKKIIYTCDGCGGEGYVSLYRCFICGKEFCPDCIIHLQDDLKIWHMHEMFCCNWCWEAGRYWREYMDGIEREFLKMIEEEISDWKESISGCDKDV